MSRKLSENLLAESNVNAVSCRISRGELLPALSAVKFGSNVPEGVLFAGHSEGSKRFFLCASGKMYISAKGGDFGEYGVLSGSSPFMIEDIENGTPRAVVVSGSAAIINEGLTFRGYGLPVELSCGVMHCGRLFGADADDGYVLHWSGEGGIEDFEEKLNGAGKLTLEAGRGAILDILEYGEKLVLVRKYGLTVLSMFGSPENFSVEITDTDTDLIFKGTARVVCGKLLFVTSSGLKAFDGTAINRITHRYGVAICEPTCSAEFAGAYFLGCKINGERCVLCYRPEDGESYIIEIAADGICTADCVYVYNDEGAYKLTEDGEFTFTAETDFGTVRRKTVTEICVNGTADIEISNGKLMRRFYAACGIIRPRLRGERFTVKVTGSEPVHSLTAKVEVCNEV